MSISKNILRIPLPDRHIDIDFHRYICHMDNVFYGPDQVGLLSADGRTVISAHPLNVPLDATGMSFGKRESVLPDGRQRLHFEPPSHTVDAPAVCLHFSTGPAVFLRDVVLGAFRAHRMLGEKSPVLIPAGFNDRQRAFLALAGVEDQDLLEVPAHGTTRVGRAIMPSRSFARDVRFRAGDKWHNLRFLMESEDTRAFNALIQERFGGGTRRRLYISRADASTRGIINEDAVARRLEDFGFERLVLSEMPVLDLVAAFANAEMILGPHGSGLTNILFSPPTTRVIEIDHPRSDYVAHGLSRTLGQGFRIFGKIREADRERTSSISQTVDIKALTTVVEDEIGKLKPLS